MFKSFVDYVNYRINEEMQPKLTANEAIKDLLHLNLGEKLLYDNQPIQIENIIVDANDSSNKRINNKFKSVKEAADFVDKNTNLVDGTIEVYFGNNPIYLVNISHGTITRHQLADKLLQKVKPMQTHDAEDDRWERMEHHTK